MLNRRDFLTTSAAAAAAVLAPSRLLAAVQQQTPPMPDLSRWSDVRVQFDLNPNLIHFATFYLVSHPRPVREAIEAYRRALDQSPFLEVEQRMFSDKPENLQLKVRDDMCGYLGAKREEIAITGNTTTSLAMVWHGLPLAAGDDVLTTTHDHYSHHECIRFATQRAGATVRKVALYRDPAKASVAEIAQNLRAAIRPNTRAIGVTWVHSSTGVRLPLRDLVRVVADANRGRSEDKRALLVVDGVHGFGCTDETVGTIGCDYFCAGTHKWMFAPRGTGIIWANADNWARLRPLIPTFTNQPAFEAWLAGEPPPSPVNAYDMTPGGFHAYEHQWAMSAAFRFHEQIGKARVAQRIRELNDRCKAGLAAIPGVRVLTPRDSALSAGIIAFEVQGKKTDEVVAKLLDRHIVGSASPYNPAMPRLAPSLVNTPEEVDEAVKAVKAIAAAK